MTEFEEKNKTSKSLVRKKHRIKILYCITSIDSKSAYDEAVDLNKSTLKHKSQNMPPIKRAIN
jgi:hypothetical protein